MIIQTKDTIIQSFFLKTYISKSLPIMFVGPTGTGKSAITNSHIVSLPKEELVWLFTEVLFWL